MWYKLQLVKTHFKKRKKIILNYFVGTCMIIGEEQARECGKLFKKKDFIFDVAFTSILQRAIKTLEIIKSEIEQSNLPVIETWRLNERHYGALTGLTKENSIYTKAEVFILMQL